MEECYDHESEEDFSTKTPENILSGDEDAYIPPRRRSGRGARKRVVIVPIGGGGDGYRSRGEVYPPPDSWSWRKYGQKPIKGSPYPRKFELEKWYKNQKKPGCTSEYQHTIVFDSFMENKHPGDYIIREVHRLGPCFLSHRVNFFEISNQESVRFSIKSLLPQLFLHFLGPQPRPVQEFPAIY